MAPRTSRCEKSLGITTMNWTWPVSTNASASCALVSPPRLDLRNRKSIKHLTMSTPYVSTRKASEAQAWEALKALGDTALAQGGLQAVLQMFVGTLTGAEEVARVSEEAGHPETMTPEVIAQWISVEYVPSMQNLKFTA
jgi:hypothetical protein